MRQMRNEADVIKAKQDKHVTKITNLLFGLLHSLFVVIIFVANLLLCCF